jgi:hypothetical protein
MGPSRQQSAEPFWRVTAAVAILMCALLIGERWWRNYWLAVSEPRPLAPRSDLIGEEQRTTELVCAHEPFRGFDLRQTPGWIPG